MGGVINPNINETQPEKLEKFWKKQKSPTKNDFQNTAVIWRDANDADNKTQPLFFDNS